MKLSVIIPAFNEAGAIYDNLGEIKRAMQELGRSFEIVVSDDGSVDETYSEVLRFKAKNENIKVVHSSYNRGKGHAIMKGIEQSTGDIVIFIDADLDISPRRIGSLLNYMEKEDADLVIGSKAHPLSRFSHSGQRRFLSLGFRFLIRLFFQLPVNDTQTGLKVIRSAAIKQLLQKIQIREYAFDLELLILAKKFNFKIVEAPIVIYSMRTIRRIRAKDVLKILRDTIKIFYRLHIIRYYD